MPKLLLADDSVTIQRVIELTFSGEDIQVISVSDGEEAVARIVAERPDVVLADIGMPRRNGYEVAAFVKGRPDLAHIPVLLLAGAFEPVDQLRAEQVKCDGVLVKPFEPQQVIARVRELVSVKPVGRSGTAPRDLVAGDREGGAPSEASLTRKPEPPPIVEMPEPTAAEVSDSLDDYFDRLDAAFASLNTNRGEGAGGPSPARLDDLGAHEDVPTIDELLTGVPIEAPGSVPPPTGRLATPPVEPPDSTPTLTAGSTPLDGPAGESPARNLIADAFATLLAAEHGGSGSAGGSANAEAPAITDDLVDELTRRVLERLAPDAVRDVVARVVSDVSERLVLEEIARIRAARG